MSNFESRYRDITELIYDIYNKKYNNLKDFLKNTNKKKNIIFTFSNQFDPIFIDNIENNNESYQNDENCRKLGNISDMKTKKIDISSLKSEKDFENKIKDFYKCQTSNLCLLKFTEKELNKMSHIDFSFR